MLNKIPVIGTLLGGGQNEGIIGISYRVQGPINSPQVSVNPLSAIAPGILRKILGVVDGSVSGGIARPTRVPTGRPGGGKPAAFPLVQSIPIITSDALITA